MAALLAEVGCAVSRVDRSHGAIQRLAYEDGDAIAQVKPWLAEEGDPAAAVAPAARCSAKEPTRGRSLLCCVRSCATCAAAPLSRMRRCPRLGKRRNRTCVRSST